MGTVFAGKTSSSAFRPKQGRMRVFFRKIVQTSSLGMAKGILVTSFSLLIPLASCIYTDKYESLERVAKALCVSFGGYTVSYDASCANCWNGRGALIIPYDNQPIQRMSYRDFENVDSYGVSNLGYMDPEGQGHLLDYDNVNLFHNTRFMLHCSNLT